MDYGRLADEYNQEAKRLKNYINKIKKGYGKPINLDNREMYYRIKILYGMYLELSHVGEYLSKKCGVVVNDK